MGPLLPVRVVESQQLTHVRRRRVDCGRVRQRHYVYVLLRVVRVVRMVHGREVEVGRRRPRDRVEVARVRRWQVRQARSRSRRRRVRRVRRVRRRVGRVRR